MNDTTPPRALGLVVHPTEPVGSSVATIARWTADHGIRLLAREQDRGRLEAEVEFVSDPEFVTDVDGVLSARREPPN